MKKLIGVLAAFVICILSSSTTASAREGRLELANTDVSCEGVSLWRESSYKISGRCQGLVYPYETLSDHYVIWATLENGNTVRIDDIDRGYFEGSVSDPFASIFVTAESAGTPRRPSTKNILSGSIQAFEFDKSETTVAPTPTPAAKSNTGTMTVQNTNNAAVSGTTVGSVIGKILKSLLIIVAVVIVVAVVASLLFRRRGSVSA